MKTITGHYIINYYNKYGVRLADLSDTAPNLEAAKQKAERRQFEPQTADDNHSMPASYTVDRRIFNSEDKW